MSNAVIRTVIFTSALHAFVVTTAGADINANEALALFQKRTTLVRAKAPSKQLAFPQFAEQLHDSGSAFTGVLLPSAVPSAEFRLGGWSVIWRGGPHLTQPSLTLRNQRLNRTVLSTSGPFVSASTLSHRATNAFNGCVKLEALPRQSVRASQFQSVTSIRESGGRLTVSGEVFSNTSDMRRCSYTIAFQERAAGATEPLNFSVTLGACDRHVGDYTEVSLHYRSTADEAFWGFGEQQDHFDMKGRFLPLVNSEHGFGRANWWVAKLVDLAQPGCGGAWWSTYMGLPHYLSSANYSFSLNNQETTMFDLTSPDTVRVIVNGTGMEGEFYAASSLLDVLSAYTAGTSGRMRALPAWSQQGAIVHTRGGADWVQKSLDRLEAHSVSLGALWIEDWSGGHERLGVVPFNPASTNWVLNNSMYPNWDSLKQQVVAYGGAELLGYVSASFKHYPGLSKTQDVYREAEANGYLMKWCNGSTYLTEANAGGGSALLDLSNTAAVKWFQTRILARELVEHAGMKGWMADFGERSPLNPLICLHSGEDPFAFHNKYSEIWVDMQTSWMKGENKTDDLLPFVRTGRIHSPGKIRLFWTGDQMTNSDVSNGLPSALMAMLSVGLSGFSLSHSDIGGEGGILLPGMGRHTMPFANRHKSVLFRWIELATFSAVFRTHLGNCLHANYQIDTDGDTWRHFARFSKLFAYLRVYRERVVEDEVVGRGWPLMRPMLLHYPNDKVARSLKDQFLFGSDILVAPDLTATRKCKRRGLWPFGPCKYRYSKRKVYLPAGLWIRAWHEEQNYTSGGKMFTVEIPYGRPAFFWRASWSGGRNLSAFLRVLDSNSGGGYF